MKRFVVLEKAVGETPLECAEAWRATQSSDYQTIPLAYAGRLDPMASGKLLVLIGEECKNQTNYHHLDKAYTFSILFGVQSDTADVLGLVKEVSGPIITLCQLKQVCKNWTGTVTLPYPHFSSKTVHGKPLHVWALENRLDEITIPTKTSIVYKLQVENLNIISKGDLYKTVSTKIETIKPVIDPKKSLGNDFRRPHVRTAWETILNTPGREHFQIATISCTASSGTYMRTLAKVIANDLSTGGLAYAINRTDIGVYKMFGPLGFWTTRYHS